MAQDVTLDQRTINNWNPLRFQTLPNAEAQQTLEKTLQWYNSYLEKYAPEASLPAYENFQNHVDALRSTYKAAKPDGLDPSERRELLAGAYGVDRDLSKLIERADVDRLTGKATKPVSETDGGAKKPEHFGVEGKDFDGRYKAVDPKTGTLDAVAENTATIGFGAKGPQVTEAQELMLRHGAKFEKRAEDGTVEKDYGADGMFGPVTQRELQKLQKGWGLEETGALDDKTLERLRAAPTAETAEKPADVVKPADLPEIINV